MPFAEIIHPTNFVLGGLSVNTSGKHRLMEQHLSRPAFLNLRGVDLQREGGFASAEQIHRLALDACSKSEEDPRGNSALRDVIHYNIMLAIARQPGRIEEAYAFREKHLDFIRRDEKTYGTLTVTKMT